jgi:hypothetical protein
MVAATLDDGSTRRINDADSTYALATRAIAAHSSIATQVAALGLGEELNIIEALEERCILAPIDHQDSAHVWPTGTGLTHLGSADTRDRMHAKAQAAEPSDSMKMFLLGLAGGKVSGPGPGVQPEWFYKGDGRSLVAPETPLTSPQFALDAGEEPELAGIYLIAPDGTPCRLGFTLANEFSDVHVHFFGTATLSFADGIKARDGDVFEIEAEPFGLPLRNAWHTAAAPAATVRNL